MTSAETPNSRCIFCEIVARRAEASIIYEDERVLSFMTIRSTRPGECLVIPKAHVDHFQDLDDATAAHILTVGQRIARTLQNQFAPKRVGYVVSGFGVAHAHLVIIPLHDMFDITSARYATIENGSIRYSENHVPSTPRETLDEQAQRLRAALGA